MTETTKTIFKSNGIPLGFISNGFLFSRDGLYLGWLEGSHAWDASGQYRGQLMEQSGHSYILRNKYKISPVPKIPRTQPTAPAIPVSHIPIAPIALPIGWEDAF